MRLQLREALKSRPRDVRAMKNHAKHILLLLCLTAVVVTVRVSGLAGYVTLETLREHRSLLEQAVAAHYAASVLLYILLYIAVALTIPGALVLTLAGGLLFHTFPGVVYVITGATVGGVLAFLLSRHLLGDRLQTRYEAQFRRFNRELEQNGPSYLLAARLIPVFPFFLVNFLCGLTRLPLKTFVWTTAAGILPASLIYAFAGSQAGAVSSPNDLLSPRMLFALSFLALLILSPLLWKKMKGRRAGRSFRR